MIARAGTPVCYAETRVAGEHRSARLEKKGSRMNFPDFYEPNRVGTLYVPNTSAAIAAGLSTGASPSSEDTRRILLLLVDAQVDFIHEDGALSVPGAVADTRRTIEWLFRNLGHITSIAASLDSHTPFHIFYPTWWADAEGESPSAFTAITGDAVTRGQWIPRFEPDWSLEYVRQLEAQAKKTLMIWPYHTMIGTPGQAITPALYEAIAFHAGARSARPEFLSKGYLDRTEHYSIVEPEVKLPAEVARGGDLNTPFLEMLATYDLIYIAGQAKSHCVLETITSIMSYFHSRPEVICRLRLLVDCTSSVAHPQIDFEMLANAALAEFELTGMRLVRSADPIG
jgi:nicotinamidase/pyrazinamidase